MVAGVVRIRWQMSRQDADISPDCSIWDWLLIGNSFDLSGISERRRTHLLVGCRYFCCIVVRLIIEAADCRKSLSCFFGVSLSLDAWCKQRLCSVRGAACGCICEKSNDAILNPTSYTVSRSFGGNTKYSRLGATASESTLPLRLSGGEIY